MQCPDEALINVAMGFARLPGGWEFHAPDAGK